MKKPLITITTDFGDGFATSQLKVIVAGLGYTGHLVENHDVKPYSIVEGAYGIWQLAKYCPKGSVHVGVVDPGVGSDRAGIVIKTKNFWFVGPDNGLLYPAAVADGIERIWKIIDFENVSNTFHGRDVFIKQAVWLAQGKEPRGEEIEEIKRLSFEEGQVVHIDHYGNAKIWGKKTFGLPVVKTFS
ncbi:MAG TPA: SAM-dependent chlorinase/fluorinase, partial [Patescibacteria group bacterium]|nr:SAM-dependent chlorinase/fluorinase [Patescibacteria group bacterium]